MIVEAALVLLGISVVPTSTPAPVPVAAVTAPSAPAPAKVSVGKAKLTSVKKKKGKATLKWKKVKGAFVFPLAASAFFVESPTPSNAEEAMVVSAGILISFKFGTFLKASSPMVFNDCGSCTFSRFPHFSNVPFSMAVSPSERYTL